MRDRWVFCSREGGRTKIPVNAKKASEINFFRGLLGSDVAREILNLLIYQRL
nr:MAG TPA: hypothetical protein [Caudoviricetes sp.]